MLTILVCSIASRSVPLVSRRSRSTRPLTRTRTWYHRRRPRAAPGAQAPNWVWERQRRFGAVASRSFGRALMLAPETASAQLARGSLALVCLVLAGFRFGPGCYARQHGAGGGLGACPLPCGDPGGDVRVVGVDFGGGVPAAGEKRDDQERGLPGDPGPARRPAVGEPASEAGPVGCRKAAWPSSCGDGGISRRAS